MYRLNIKNKDYELMKEKRDRAVRYWKDRVIQEFLPPIDAKKRNELNERVNKLNQGMITKQESQIMKKQ
jgi:hypothetical protein